nr:reverse transcriptase domain-containing protein [Tanacetum cinerariifolium]
MRTRSKSYSNNSNATIPRRSNRRRVPNIVEPEIRTIKEIVPMADRTMEELLQAPTEGYGEDIVILKILMENFEIKINLLQLVQTNKFHGFERDNPHTHISNFKRMTSTLKYRDVPNDAIKLMLFPYSLEDAARIWYEKEPPNSILTWDDLVNKFVNQFFPPSKTTHLKNKISRFTQRFDETFGEAWERFKEMLKACPHQGFSELTQIDTFYNGLNKQDQDSLNAAVGGNLLIEIVNKQVITHTTAKVVKKTCVICGGARAYYDCIATDSNQPSVCAATDVIDIACEEFVQDVLDFKYNSKSSNPTLVSNPSISKSDFCKEPIVKSSSPTLTPFGESDFFLEEIEDFLNDESIPTGIEDSFYDPKGDILYLEKLLNDDPSQLLSMDLKQAEETKAKSSIEEPPELELKEVPYHLEYAFLEETNKLSVIIAKDLKDDEKETLFFDHYDDPSFPRPPSEPPDGICEHYVLMPKILPTLPTFDPLYPMYDTLLPFSSENEDKVFKPGILSYLLISHRDKTTFDFYENPMMIYGGDIPSKVIPDLHTIPMDK